MKKSLIVLMSILLVAVFAFSACSGSGEKTEADTTADTTAAAASITEDEARAIVLEKHGVPETAAENLTVKSTQFEGEDAFVVAFSWSGFDYETTVNASGKIVKDIFDGDELPLEE